MHVPSQNQLSIYIVTSTQNWLGISKLKNVFISTINPSTINWYEILKTFYSTEFSTDWLTDWLINWPTNASIQAYLDMAKATDLISSLFNVASSRDMPFYQLQQLQCLHHCSTEAHLWAPCLYPLPRRWQSHIMASVSDWGKCRTSSGASYVTLCLECEKLKANESLVMHHD